MRERISDEVHYWNTCVCVCGEGGENKRMKEEKELRERKWEGRRIGGGMGERGLKEWGGGKERRKK